MLYKRQLGQLRTTLDNATPHSACRELRTMQRHTLLAENIDISLRCNCVYGLSVIAEM